MHKKLKQFLTIFVLIALIGSNVCLFFLWSESNNNLEVVKLNALEKLYDCNYFGYSRPTLKDLDNNALILPLGGLNEPFK
jgi:hypothetical protein